MERCEHLAGALYTWNWHCVSQRSAEENEHWLLSISYSVDRIKSFTALLREPKVSYPVKHRSSNSRSGWVRVNDTLSNT